MWRLMALNKSHGLAKPIQLQPKFTATRMVKAYLIDLKKTGVYGPRVPSVIAHFVTAGIERAIQAGVIKPRRKPPTDADLVDDDEE